MIVGLTGQSGAGKSMLSKRFAEHGFAVLNADEISHEVTAHGACLRTLCEVFGEQILDENKQLDRRRLGKIVFSDPAQLERLNRTVLPFIVDEINRKIAELKSRGVSFILLDAPTLYEAGADRLCDVVIAACAPYEQRLERILSRDHITLEQAQMRLSAQHDEAFYQSRANAVLINDGTPDEFYEKADRLIDYLQK